MQRPGSLLTLMLIPLALTALAPTAPSQAPNGKPRQGEALRIEMHVGIPAFVYIGQSLPEVLKKFPRAQVLPFSGQEDAKVVKIAEEGISCVAVGDPGDLKLASVGFNLDGAHEGIVEGKFRTRQGIGKGSTVNDVLETYGQPVEILGEQPRSGLKRTPAPEDPSVPKMYQYANEDGSIKTYFLIVDHLVKRIVVNHLAPLDQHIVKGGQKK
jgi:hypothetical protein